MPGALVQAWVESRIGYASLLQRFQSPACPPAGQLPPELQYTAGVAEDASDLWEQMEASRRPRLPLMACWLWCSYCHCCLAFTLLLPPCWCHCNCCRPRYRHSAAVSSASQRFQPPVSHFATLQERYMKSRDLPPIVERDQQAADAPQPASDQQQEQQRQQRAEQQQRLQDIAAQHAKPLGRQRQQQAAPATEAAAAAAAEQQARHGQQQPRERLHDDA